jgi:hypothetical protein
MDHQAERPSRLVAGVEGEVRRKMNAEKPTSNTSTSHTPSAEELAGAVYEYEELHFGDVLQNWVNGVQLDIRTKLAVEFVKAGMLVRHAGVVDLTPSEVAERALDVATELLNLSFSRGLTKPLPETDELSPAHKRHLLRAVRSNVYPQTQMQRIAEEEGADRRVAQVAPGMRLPPA